MLRQIHRLFLALPKLVLVTNPLLQLILMLGNFLNGSGYQGGAFGIKISSINKLVDTKGSKENTTLLHFLVDVVESKFPRIYNFLDDLKSTDAACKGTF